MGDTPWCERETIVLEISKTVRGNPAISCMLAIDVVIAAILIYFKFKAHPANVEYMHLLVTYQFGFMKRALVGTVVSFFAQKVPIYFVYAIGLTVWLLTLILYVALFFRSLGCHKDRALLFVFIVGSPFFFKNFLFSVGYFDIYGCAFDNPRVIGPGQRSVPSDHDCWMCRIAAHTSLASVYLHSDDRIHFYRPVLSAVTGDAFQDSPWCRRDDINIDNFHGRPACQCARSA
jgi:hypothetical protein